jgi:dihydroorotate dehydrogenase
MASFLRLGRLPPVLPKLARPASTSTTAASSAASSSARSASFALRVGLAAAGTLAVVVYYSDVRAAVHRYVVPPALRVLFDAETAHRLALQTLAFGLGPRDWLPDDERLKTEVRLRFNVGASAG